MRRKLLRTVCKMKKMFTWKRAFIAAIVGFCAWEWFGLRHKLTFLERRFTVGKHVQVRVATDDTINLDVSTSSAGREAIRIVLGGGLASSVSGQGLESSSVDGNSLTAEVLNVGRLELRAAGTDQEHDVHCYTVRWRLLKADRHAVVDCFSLGSGYWYGGTEVLEQRWPMNGQRSVMQPHVTGDSLVPKWRNMSWYGKYGSVAEAYWVSSDGFGIFVDGNSSLYSSFNSGGDGRLCLKSDSPASQRGDGVQSNASTDLNYTFCVGQDVLSVHRAMSKMFVQRPTGIPDKRLIKYPIWSTWAQYKTHVNQSSVMDFAHKIRQNNFPSSQLEIDDRFSSTYGQFDFDASKFENASEMIRELHRLGFRVTTWMTPFANLDCPAFVEGAAKECWIADSSFPEDYVPALTQWWCGVGGVLDVSNPSAVEWFVGRLQKFQQEFGVDSFKFDSGEVSYLPPRRRMSQPLSHPSQYSALYARMTARFGGAIEIRTGFRSQDLPVFVRMLDKDSIWGYNNGLLSVIPTALQFSITGYSFILPDMIGGNAYSPTAGVTVLPDRELYIRWLELTAFLPTMQFSIAPWQYDTETVDIAHKFLKLREKLVVPETEKAAKESVKNGSPIIRPLGGWIRQTTVL